MNYEIQRVVCGNGEDSLVADGTSVVNGLCKGHKLITMTTGENSTVSIEVHSLEFCATDH